MKTFKVRTVQTVYEVAYVEANSKEEAIEAVMNDTGAVQFDFLDSADWQIVDAVEQTYKEKNK